MSDPFDSAFAKIHRAHEHVQALAYRIDAWLKTDPYEIVTKLDDDRWQVGRFHVLAPPHMSLSLLAGDAVHNARSALDHAIYELSRAPAKKRRKVAFPLNRNRVDYLESKRNGSWERSLAGVHPKYWAVIERSQPFRRGNSQLGALARLDNGDKHRFVAVGLMRQSEPPVFTVPVGNPGDLEFRFWPFGRRFHEGAEVWRFRARRVRKTGPPAVAVKIQFGVTVAFGRGNYTVDDLQAMVNRAANVVMELRELRGPRVETYTEQIGGAVAMAIRSNRPPWPPATAHDSPPAEREANGGSPSPPSDSEPDSSKLGEDSP